MLPATLAATGLVALVAKSRYREEYYQIIVLLRILFFVPEGDKVLPSTTDQTPHTARQMETSSSKLGAARSEV